MHFFILFIYSSRTNLIDTSLDDEGGCRGGPRGGDVDAYVATDASSTMFRDAATTLGDVRRGRYRRVVVVFVVVVVVSRQG